MAKLILLRHGASLWNDKNLFTGWVDIPLSPQGIAESLGAGRKIPHPIDIIFTSALIRSQMTAMLAMSMHASGKVPCIQHRNEGRPESWAEIYSEETKKECIPMHATWYLNERMYGKLQGMNKDEARQKYGAEQVQIWRRSFDAAPPGGESLEMTAKRAVPFFQHEILPCVREGKNVLVCAHGNSLRAIVMVLENLSPEQVVQVEMATGEPVVYTYDQKWSKDG